METDPSSGHPRPVPASSPSRLDDDAHAHVPAGVQSEQQPNTGSVPSGLEAAAEAEAGTGAQDGAAVVPMTTAHLARFEFSDQGTKVLMVEWHPGAVRGPDDAPPHPAASVSVPAPASVSTLDSDPAHDVSAWHISWPGKSTVLPASESDRDQDGARRRIYFLLPTDAPIPAAVTVTGPGGRPPLLLKPLPAIFPEGFDFEAGPRGVLHTIWAKKRLSELDREMDAEMRTNAESVGLEMARTERQWIVDNFLPAPPPSPSAKESDSGAQPSSPRSQGRLNDKLKGLRLATGPTDLMPSPTANTFTGAGAQSLTLSPTGGDVAVSSFPVRPSNNTSSAPMSLNAALHGDLSNLSAGLSRSQDAEDGLFALPMSPRSPDMKRSPFSIL